MTKLHVAVLEFSEDMQENTEPFSLIVGVYDDRLTAVRNGLKAEILKNIEYHSMKYVSHDYLDFYEIIDTWTLSMLFGPDISDAREEFLGEPKFQMLSTGYRLELHEVELNATWTNEDLTTRMEKLKLMAEKLVTNEKKPIEESAGAEKDRSA